MNLNNIKLPKMVTNPDLPIGVYEKMREQEQHDEAVQREEQQIALLREQNELLKEQNQALKEANDESNKELKKSKESVKFGVDELLDYFPGMNAADMKAEMFSILAEWKAKQSVVGGESY